MQGIEYLNKIIGRGIDRLLTCHPMNACPSTGGAGGAEVHARPGHRERQGVGGAGRRRRRARATHVRRQEAARVRGAWRRLWGWKADEADDRRLGGGWRVGGG